MPFPRFAPFALIVPLFALAACEQRNIGPAGDTAMDGGDATLAAPATPAGQQPPATSAAAGERPVSGRAVADTLERAADQSAPAARKVLEQAADDARGRASMAPVHRPGSYAQRAMERAGKAEASAAATTSGY